MRTAAVTLSHSTDKRDDAIGLGADVIDLASLKAGAS